MKKLLLILILALSSMLCIGQYTSASLSVQGVDLGVGIRVDHYFKSNMGIYGSLSYGDWYLYRHNNLRNHYKGTIGVAIPIPDRDGLYDPNDNCYVTLGYNTHLLDKVGESIVDDIIFQKHSFELGITRQITKYIIFAVRTDVLRWEPCIDVGIIFGKNNKSNFKESIKWNNQRGHLAQK